MAKTTNPTAWHQEMRGKVIDAGLGLDENSDAVLGLVAVEVEQLRSDLGLRSQTAFDRKEIIQLEAEIERLREALSLDEGGDPARDSELPTAEDVKGILRGL